MIHRVGGAFRSAPLGPPPGFNAWDLVALNPPTTAPASSWTAGAGIVDTVQVRTPTTSPWDLLAFTVQAALVLADTNFTFIPYFGKLGRVIAGVTNGLPTNSGTTGFYQLSLPPLPQDASLQASLWDPAVDPLPPIVRNAVPAQPPVLEVTAAQNLQQPLAVPAGGQINLGIWVLPSLLNTNTIGNNGTPCLSMTVCNAEYVVIYDDHS